MGGYKTPDTMVERSVKVGHEIKEGSFYEQSSLVNNDFHSRSKDVLIPSVQPSGAPENRFSLS